MTVTAITPPSHGGEPDPHLFTPSRYSWAFLNQDEAAELWDELIDWVGWLRTRYELTSAIPVCWFRHSRAVEELTALMAAYHAAYDATNGEERPYWSDMIAWHTYHFRPFESSIDKLGMQSCNGHDCGALIRDAAARNLLGVSEFVGDNVSRRPVESRLKRSAAPSTPTLTPKEMKAKLLAGQAEPTDIHDPQTSYQLDGRTWRFDAHKQAFVPDINPSTT